MSQYLEFLRYIQFLLHVAMPKACYRIWEFSIHKPILALNFSNLILLLCYSFSFRRIGKVIERQFLPFSFFPLSVGLILKGKKLLLSTCSSSQCLGKNFKGKRNCTVVGSKRLASNQRAKTKL